jgi:membrane carboxypeptidase/penicillin-binding protein PbpC
MQAAIFFMSGSQTVLGNPELDPRVAYLITSILSDDEARFPSFGRGSSLSLGARPSAAKTGTTTDFRDNWTVGYTPNLVVGVWVGNADNTPMREVSGVSGAGPIWNQFTRRVLNDQPMLPFSVPEGIERAEVCAMSGLLPTPECPQRAWDWFIAGTQPQTYDNFYQTFVIDKTTGLLADENTPEENQEQQVFLVLPPEARAWAVSEGIPSPPLGAQVVGYEAYPVRLLNPDPYTIFQLSPSTPLETQRIRLSVAYPSGTAAIEYWLDGTLLSKEEQEPFERWWELLPGQHTFKAVAVLPSGDRLESADIEFRVNSWVPPEERPTSGEAE